MLSNPTTTFWELFLGSKLPEFTFSMFLVLLGIILYTLVRIRNRREKNKEFSWGVWWNRGNNRLELVISLLVVYPQIRFAQVYEGWIMSILPDTFNAVPFFVMFASGFLQHYILVQIFKWTKE